MSTLDIVIISDTVCPFCYLGRARLDRALGLLRKTVPGGSSTAVTIRWHAYMLDRHPPTASVPVQDVAAARFGADRLPAKQERMAQLGAQDGFDFSFAGRIGDTRDSHRVVQLGMRKGLEVADKVMGEVMAMFFERGGDITSWEDLTAAAERAGVDKEEAMRWLEEGEGGDEVDREVAEAEKMGVKGVPKFIINGRYEVDGAEDVSGFLEQLVRAKEEADEGAASTQTGQVCELGGTCVS